MFQPIIEFQANETMQSTVPVVADIQENIQEKREISEGKDEVTIPTNSFVRSVPVDLFFKFFLLYLMI